MNLKKYFQKLKLTYSTSFFRVKWAMTEVVKSMAMVIMSFCPLTLIKLPALSMLTFPSLHYPTRYMHVFISKLSSKYPNI